MGAPREKSENVVKIGLSGTCEPGRKAQSWRTLPKRVQENDPRDMGCPVKWANEDGGWALLGGRFHAACTERQEGRCRLTLHMGGSAKPVKDLRQAAAAEPRQARPGCRTYEAVAFNRARAASARKADRLWI